jgi:HYR domain
VAEIIQTYVSFGSRFKIGRTVVRCSATDTSGNAGVATFAVTVKRRSL